MNKNVKGGKGCNNRGIRNVLPLMSCQSHCYVVPEPMLKRV